MYSVRTYEKSMFSLNVVSHIFSSKGNIRFYYFFTYGVKFLFTIVHQGCKSVLIISSTNFSLRKSLCIVNYLHNKDRKLDILECKNIVPKMYYRVVSSDAQSIRRFFLDSLYGGGKVTRHL